MIPGSEDRALARRARRGDARAYAVLVSRWEKKVYNYLLRSLGNREDALDACQETFFKAYRGLPRLADTGRFPQWLFRIAHNEAASLHRRPQPASAVEDIEATADFASLPGIRVGGFGYGDAELAFLVEQALGALPVRQREAVLLKVTYGFKFDEIAEILDCPASTVKSRLYAAFDALRAVLEPVTNAKEVRT